MKASDELTYMAALYMALADKTRLRILNLLRDQEVCVGYFTDILGDSQPKISRHLAYLRNAGIVEARRDGKWMHYKIKWPDDSGTAGIIDAALRSLSFREECRSDMQKFFDHQGRAGAAEQNETTRELDIYAGLYMSDEIEDERESRASHNDLEEFLL